MRGVVYMYVCETVYVCCVDAYTTEDLEFHWRTDAKSVEMNDNISLPEYIITNVTHTVCTKNFSSTGMSVCLSVTLQLPAHTTPV